MHCLAASIPTYVSACVNGLMVEETWGILSHPHGDAGSSCWNRWATPSLLDRHSVCTCVAQIVAWSDVCGTDCSPEKAHFFGFLHGPNLFFIQALYETNSWICVVTILDRRREHKFIYWPSGPKREQLCKAAVRDIMVSPLKGNTVARLPSLWDVRTSNCDVTG